MNWSNFSTHLRNLLTKPPDWPKRSEVQVFDDHLPLLRSSRPPDVPGRLLRAPPVPAAHYDPGLELQQLRGQGPPDPAVSPGHDDRLPPHRAGRIPEQLAGFFHGKQAAHEDEDPSADNSGDQHRGGHGSGDRRQVRGDEKGVTVCCVSKLQKLPRK